MSVESNGGVQILMGTDEHKRSLMHYRASTGADPQGRVEIRAGVLDIPLPNVIGHGQSTSSRRKHDTTGNHLPTMHNINDAIVNILVPMSSNPAYQGAQREFWVRTHEHAVTVSTLRILSSLAIRLLQLAPSICQQVEPV